MRAPYSRLFATFSLEHASKDVHLLEKSMSVKGIIINVLVAVLGAAAFVSEAHRLDLEPVVDEVGRDTGVIPYDGIDSGASSHDVQLIELCTPNNDRDSATPAVRTVEGFEFENNGKKIVMGCIRRFTGNPIRPGGSANDNFVVDSNSPRSANPRIASLQIIATDVNVTN